MKTEKNILYCMTDGIPDELAIREEPEPKLGHVGRPKTNGEQVLQIARRCEDISRRGGDHAGEYHKIAQHLKKSAGHLLALERNGNT